LCNAVGLINQNAVNRLFPKRMHVGPSGQDCGVPSRPDVFFPSAPQIRSDLADQGGSPTDERRAGVIRGTAVK
jgi:hypothetical protein